jgi:VWFA-related protein
LKWDPEKQTARDPHVKTAPQSQGDGSIRLKTLLVVLDVLVVEGKTNRVINGLGKDDFVVIEDDRRQNIAEVALAPAAPLPRSIILIIDYSGSQIPFLEKSVAAAKILIDQLGPSDKMAIVNDDVKLLADFTQDKEELKKTLDGLKKHPGRGRSLQFSALLASLRELTDEETRSIIIFQTDGDQCVALRDQPGAERHFQEYGRAEFGLSDVYSTAERSSATVYSVVTNGRLIGVPPEQAAQAARDAIKKTQIARIGRVVSSGPLLESQVRDWIAALVPGQNAMTRTAALTSGITAFLDRPEQANEIYSMILNDMAHRYVITYYPDNIEPNRERRKVRVEVRGHPEYVVHSRKSYYFRPAG